MDEDARLVSLYKSKTEKRNDSLEFAYVSVMQRLDKDVHSKQMLMQILQRAGKNPSLHEVNRIWIEQEDGMTFKDVEEVSKDLKTVTRSELLSAFKKIDSNGDGFITESELYKVFTSRGEKMTFSEVKKVLANADQNRDGKLDYIEFCDMMLQTCNKMQGMTLEVEQTYKEKKIESSSNHSVINRSRPSSAVSSVKVRSRRESGASDRTYSVSQTNFERLDGNIVQIKLPPAQNTKQNINPPTTLKGWSRASSKGCLFVGNENVITTHLFKLDLTFASNVWITMENYLPEKSQNDASCIDSGFFIYRRDEDGEADELVSFSESIFEEKWCWRGDLRSGSYTIVPFTTGCRLRHKETDEDEEEVKLTRTDQNGEVQLSNIFRKTLDDIFDICDLDGDMKLSREEFNCFQLITSDEQVDDEAWNIVSDSVEMEEGKITKRGFYELHLMQAREEGVDPQEELMDSLIAMGFTPKLSLNQACPFHLNVYTKDCRPSLKLTSLSSSENDLLNKGFVQSVIAKGKQFDFTQKLRLYLYKNANRVTAAVENQNARSVMLTCDCTSSENIVTKRRENNFSVEIPAQSSMLLDHALPLSKRNPWTYRCQVAAVEAKSSSRPRSEMGSSSRRTSVSSRHSTASSVRRKKPNSADIFN